MEDAKKHFNQTGAILWLWFGALASPVVWIFDQQIKYMILTYVCSNAGLMILHVVTLLSLLVVGGGVLVSWRSLRQAQTGDSKNGVVARTRFMGLLGILSGILFALLIIAQWLPSFFFHPCER